MARPPGWSCTTHKRSCQSTGLALGYEQEAASPPALSDLGSGTRNPEDSYFGRLVPPLAALRDGVFRTAIGSLGFACWSTGHPMSRFEDPTKAYTKSNSQRRTSSDTSSYAREANCRNHLSVSHAAQRFAWPPTLHTTGALRSPSIRRIRPPLLRHPGRTADRSSSRMSDQSSAAQVLSQRSAANSIGEECATSSTGSLFGSFEWSPRSPSPRDDRVPRRQPAPARVVAAWNLTDPQLRVLEDDDREEAASNPEDQPPPRGAGTELVASPATGGPSRGDRAAPESSH